MALEKRIEYDHHVTAMGYIEVRQDTQIWEDGRMLSHAYDRHVLYPGQDTSQEDERGKAIAAAVHTPEVIAAFWEAERLRGINVRGIDQEEASLRVSKD